MPRVRLSDERRETLVGVAAAFVLAAVLVVTALGNRRAEQTAQGGAFSLTADFARADGIYTGSPVRVAGLNVGTVTKADLANGRAVMTLRFHEPIVLPDDTAAVIETDGLFGAKYIELRPGGTEDYLKAGGRISYTQDAVILEDLVAQVVSRARSKAKANEQKNQDTP